MPPERRGGSPASGPTPQARAWAGEFGRAYTERNVLDPAALDALCLERYGHTRRALNERFLGGVDRGGRVLEVGANVGNQLLLLQEMGFADLWGVELQEYAVERARERTRGINLVRGSALDLPFKDRRFDLVFTSGVLIHIAPADLPAALREIVRCSRALVWGLEYYAPEHTPVPYRGRSDLLWKGDFARRYLEAAPELRLEREERLPYRTGSEVDAMFLLRRAGT